MENMIELIKAKRCEVCEFGKKIKNSTMMECKNNRYCPLNTKPEFKFNTKAIIEIEKKLDV